MSILLNKLKVIHIHLLIDEFFHQVFLENNQEEYIKKSDELIINLNMLNHSLMYVKPEKKSLNKYHLSFLLLLLSYRI
jgi:hypothetical protein